MILIGGYVPKDAWRVCFGSVSRYSQAGYISLLTRVSVGVSMLGRALKRGIGSPPVPQKEKLTGFYDSWLNYVGSLNLNRFWFSCAFALAMLGIGAMSPALAQGPSFDCKLAHTTVGIAICHDPAMALADLKYAQAFFALKQQNGVGEADALVDEATTFESLAATVCGFSPGGRSPAYSATSVSCLRAQYEEQRLTWMRRLAGPAAQEAARPTDQHISLQQALHHLGFLPPTSTADGVYGTETRSAIIAWQSGRGRPASGILGDRDADALMQEDRKASGNTGEPSSVEATAPNRETVTEDSYFPMSPALAKVFYTGKASTISFQSLSATMGSETSYDRATCQAPATAQFTSCTLFAVNGKYGTRRIFRITDYGPIESNATIHPTIAIRRLDPAASIPQVVFTYYTGGAHCCAATRIATLKSTGEWVVVAAESLEGDQGYDFFDLDRNNTGLLVGIDMKFDYAFSSHAGSYFPTKIFKLSGQKLIDVSPDKKYRDFIVKGLRDMEASARSSNRVNSNGYLAAWVAQKALIGETKSAWQAMLASYDHTSDEGTMRCTVMVGSTEPCPLNKQYHLLFPEALANFLVTNQYIGADESAKLGYNVAQIEADRRQAAIEASQQHDWYLVTNDNRCIKASMPESPAYLIGFDRTNGLSDTVTVLKNDGNGKPTIVKVGEPKGNGMESVYTFVRGPDECEAYTAPLRQQFDDLK